MNALLECIKLFNTVYTMYFVTIVLLEYHSDFSLLCWHNMPACYALKFNYAGIFDVGLVASYLPTL